MSGLVKTVYGIHIIKVEDKQVAHLQSFEEVKDSIRDEMEKQRVADAQEKLASNLESQLKANPQQFEGIVRKAGLEPKLSPLFKYNQPVPDLGKTDAFENLAFQLRLNEVGTPISVPRGEAIIQVAQIVPEHVPALEEVRAQVEEDFRHEQSVTLAQDKARKLAELAKTEDFDKAAKSLGLTPKLSNDFSESEYVEGVGSGSQLSDAFTLNPGQVSGVISVGSQPGACSKWFRTRPPMKRILPPSVTRSARSCWTRNATCNLKSIGRTLKEQFIRSGKLKINEAGMKTFLASYQAQ